MNLPRLDVQASTGIHRSPNGPCKPGKLLQLSPKCSPVLDGWSMKPQVSNHSLMAGCFSKHCCSHSEKHRGFCVVRLAIARFLKSKRIRPLGWPRPKEAVPGSCKFWSCSFQRMLMPNDAKRLVCHVFACCSFSAGKTLVLGETMSKSRFWIT